MVVLVASVEKAGSSAPPLPEVLEQLRPQEQKNKHKPLRYCASGSGAHPPNDTLFPGLSFPFFLALLMGRWVRHGVWG